ncbi:MAG: isoaspartyl peptidase/L-asparaginase [Legionellales bacterium]|nr:isoaspartyl peptidase/L-asparaginase [Legionellales bacterium]
MNLIVHGGASNIPDELHEDYQQGCKNAYDEGMKILQQGGSALEAIVAAIGVMEDDPTFNAAFGACLNTAGGVNLSAGLMTGQDLRSGAIVDVNLVKNPIRLAKEVLLQSNHCLFSGNGAHEFAKQHEVAMVPESYHITPHQQALLREIQQGNTTLVEAMWHEKNHDTVGAIALDKNGNLAAGNSTGGILNQAPGRIGDAPLIGSGFYADNQLGAFVCTGWGESIMRSAMGMRALLMLKNKSAQDAANHAIDFLKKSVNGHGGILVMKPDGDVGFAYNTRDMARYIPVTL